MINKLELQMLEQLKGGECSIERALLIASGLQSERAVAGYQRKLDQIQHDFGQERASRGIPLGDDYLVAEALFEYLYYKKPRRFKDNARFLPEVVDNQLSPHKFKTIGNCVGLTSLYSVLGVRHGLDLAILRDFGHLLSLLNWNGRKIVIENTDRDGFDLDQKDESDFVIYQYEQSSLISLVSSTFNSRGRSKDSKKDYAGAIDDYSVALELDPHDAQVYINRAIARESMRDIPGVCSDYFRAEELILENNPSFRGSNGNQETLAGELN